MRLTSGEVARRSGTTTKTIRYYERIGLLPPAKRSDNHYRDYSENKVEQLRFIGRTQKMGLTLAEIRELTDSAREVRCNDLRTALDDLFARKIRDYELKIAGWKTLQRMLQREDHDCSCPAFVPDCACLPSHTA